MALVDDGGGIPAAIPIVGPAGLSITGPTGPIGLTGPIGPPGPTGPMGSVTPDQLQAATDPMKTRLDTLESAQKNGRVTRPTYDEASKLTLDPLFTYEVPFEDTGTHPGVVGEVGYLNGRVPNSGIFIAVGDAPYTLKRVSGTRMADQAFGEPGIFAFSIDKPQGGTGFAVDNLGNMINEGYEKLLELVSLIGDPGIFAWAVRNRAGEVGFAIDNNEEIINKGYQALVARVDALSAGGTGPTGPGASFPIVEAYRSLSFPTENIHALMTGQSQIVGEGGTPPLSTAPVAGVLRFNGGVRAHDTSEDPAISRTSLVPLIETAIGPRGETPASGMAKMLLQLLKAENGIDLNAQGQQLIISSPGQSSARLDQIMTGTLLARAYNDIDYAASLSKTAGRSCNSPLSVMNHGGADVIVDTPRADYRQMAVDYQNLLKVRAQAASKIPAEMPFFIFQHAGYTYYNKSVPSIALEQAAMCRDLPYWIMVGPDYIFPRIDGIHYFNTGHLLAGAYFGRAVKRVMWDHTYAPSLSVKSIVREDNRAIVQFNVPVGPLVLDRVAISDPGRAGFSLVRSDGSPIGQSKDPYVYGGDKLVLTIASTATLPAGTMVRGGWATTTGKVDAGPTTGPRTCLRDSDPMLFDPTGYRLPMHNYCPIFEQEALSR